MPLCIEQAAHQALWPVSAGQHLRPQKCGLNVVLTHSVHASD